MTLTIAAKKFITQFRRDLRTYKKKTPEQLLALLPRKPFLWDKLKLHQKVAVVLGIKYEGLGIWMEPGLGKSLTSIVLVKYFKTKAIVLVPYETLLSEWKREIIKHAPKTSYVILSGSTQQKWEKLNANPQVDITVVTYPGLMHMVCEKVIKKRKKRLDINKKRMKIIADMFDCLIMDESHNTGNRAKLPFRICRQITNKTKYNFALSGSPFGRDPINLWAQMFLIDRGESLGLNLGIFRGAFYKEQYNPFSAFPKHIFDPKKKPFLNRCLANRSIRYKANAADIPAAVNIIKEIKLSNEANTYYQKALETLRASKGNFTEVKNMFLRLRQISSGWLGYGDDETGNRAQIEFPRNRKLELLLSIIDSIYENHKIVIAHDFVFSGSIIERELNNLGIGYVRIYGKTKKTEIPSILDRFDNDKKIRILIGNQAAAFGLNLQVAQYMIRFESFPSVILQEQMGKRIQRQGSLHDKVIYYNLVVKNTVDEKILAFHQEGKDLWQEILEGKATL
jgi:SNF2 family DNA or RNA helicase